MSVPHLAQAADHQQLEWLGGGIMHVLLDGSGIFWVGENRYELSEGGIAYLPRNVPHSYRFTSGTMDVLCICTPAADQMIPDIYLTSQIR